MRVSVVDEASAVEPLTLDEAKLQLKLPVGVTHPEDSLIEDILIPTVRERAEIATNRAIRQVTVDLSLDAFTGWVELPLPPLVSIESISYVDTAGATQVLASSAYQVDNPQGARAPRARLSPIYGSYWPTARNQFAAVTIRMVVGYSPLAVPAILKQAMLLDLATLYADRENVESGRWGAPPSVSNQIYFRYRSWPTTVERQRYPYPGVYGFVY